MNHQTSIFDIIPFVPTPIGSNTYEPYWDDKESAPEHRATVRGQKMGTSPSSPSSDSTIDTTVLNDTSAESVTAAPEHMPDLDIEVYKDTPPSTNSDKSVRGQVVSATQHQVERVAPEHCVISALGETIATCPLLSEFYGVQLQPANFIQRPNSQQQPENQQYSHWVEVYGVKRGTKKHEYYRYCWRQKGKVRKFHIGPVGSGLAKELRRTAKEMIINFCTPDEIVDYLKSER